LECRGDDAQQRSSGAAGTRGGTRGRDVQVTADRHQDERADGKAQSAMPRLLDDADPAAAARRGIAVISLRWDYRASRRCNRCGGATWPNHIDDALVASCCLERPQAVSGSLWLTATFNPPFRYWCFSRGSRATRPKLLHGIKIAWRRGDRSPRDMNRKYSHPRTMSICSISGSSLNTSSGGLGRMRCSSRSAPPRGRNS
jgi:hypothetical protein